MPLGVLDDLEFEKELNSLINGSNAKGSVQPLIRGRGNKAEVPQEIRKVVAQESINGAPAAELATIFDVSESSVSAYKKGATSTASYNEPNEELGKHVNQVKDDIAKKARKNLMAALDSITPESLEGAKLRDKSGVARDMSAIIRNLEPEMHDQTNNVVYQIYAPVIHKTDDYKVIDVAE